MYTLLFLKSESFYLTIQQIRLLTYFKVMQKFANYYLLLPNYMLFHSTPHCKMIFTQILTRNLLVLMPTIKASFSKIFGRPETKFKWSNAKLSFHQCSKKCTKKLPQVWKRINSIYIISQHDNIIIIFLTIFFREIEVYF